MRLWAASVRSINAAKPIRTMSVPTAIFIDTSILDEQNYNFASAALTAFVEAAKGKALLLLLPDPTQREIIRHIMERSDAVVRALEDAKRRAPFLEKWKDWPLKKNTSRRVAYDLRQIANDEWDAFLKNFTVSRLAYDGISIVEVMNWYDRCRAPFSEKKPKEFPDAFTTAILVSFAQKEGAAVAVVSRDKDFEAACSHYTVLLHYPSLPAITEALLSGDKRVEKLKAILHGDTTILECSVGDEFTSLGFYSEANPSGDVEDVEVDQVHFADLRVINIGDAECSIAFEAEITYSAHVSYVDSFREPKRVYNGTVSDHVLTTGVAKLSIGENWDTLKGVSVVNIDQSDVAVRKEPYEFEDEDEYR